MKLLFKPRKNLQELDFVNVDLLRYRSLWDKLDVIEQKLDHLTELEKQRTMELDYF